MNPILLRSHDNRCKEHDGDTDETNSCYNKVDENHVEAEHIYDQNKDTWKPTDATNIVTNKPGAPVTIDTRAIGIATLKPKIGFT